jgi:hypothetical protein
MGLRVPAEQIDGTSAVKVKSTAAAGFQPKFEAMDVTTLLKRDFSVKLVKKWASLWILAQPHPVGFRLRRRAA